MKDDGGTGGVIEVFHDNHSWVHQGRQLRQEKLEIREERRIVQGPFRCRFVVPVLERKTMRDGEPIAMNFKIG